jgi:hypothetical protein
MARALDAWGSRPRAECPAVARHGPGHQSSTHCAEGDDPHTIHATTYGRYSAWGVWEGLESFDPDDSDEALVDRYNEEGVASARLSYRRKIEFILEVLSASRWHLMRVPEGARPILIAPGDLFEQIGTRTADGRAIMVKWGEPDAEGWWSPEFTATDDGMRLVPVKTLL